MPGRRNTRSNRKGKDADRDWRKLNEGSPIPDEKLEDNVIKTNSKKKKAGRKQQNKKIDESKVADQVDDEQECPSDVELCDELVLEGEIELSSCSKFKEQLSFSSSEEEDEEIKKAEEKLRKLKSRETKMQKGEKLKKIKEETKRLERVLQDSSNNKSTTTGKKKISKKKKTSADLRSMSDVVSKVDKLMDDKKLNFKDSDDDSDSDASYTSSSPNSDNNDSETEYRTKRRDKHGENKTSGKETRLTSFVKFPQMWPHSHLKYHFVAKAKKYDELSLAEFCAGYMSIMGICKTSHREARIAHLEELMYHATTKPWKCILNYHAACLLEIERGNLKWGDNFQLNGLLSTTLNNTGGFSSNFTSRSQAGNQYSGGRQTGAQQNVGSDERVWFCKLFQRGNCTFARDHYGPLNGENQLLRHICAKCWLTLRRKSPHSEQSETCPLINSQL